MLKENLRAACSLLHGRFECQPELKQLGDGSALQSQFYERELGRDRVLETRILLGKRLSHLSHLHKVERGGEGRERLRAGREMSRFQALYPSNPLKIQNKTEGSLGTRPGQLHVCE